MATDSEALLAIGPVAKRAGIRVSHIRYYEEIGVLPEAERVSGQRRYREVGRARESRGRRARSHPRDRRAQAPLVPPS